MSPEWGDLQQKRDSGCGMILGNKKPIPDEEDGFSLKD
jgi:hypothetical protein